MIRTLLNLLCLLVPPIVYALPMLLWELGGRVVWWLRNQPWPYILWYRLRHLGINRQRLRVKQLEEANKVVGGPWVLHWTRPFAIKPYRVEHASKPDVTASSYGEGSEAYSRGDKEAVAALIAARVVKPRRWRKYD